MDDRKVQRVGQEEDGRNEVVLTMGKIDLVELSNVSTMKADVLKLETLSEFPRPRDALLAGVDTDYLRFSEVLRIEAS